MKWQKDANHVSEAKAMKLAEAVSRGLTNKQIAQELGVAEGTIKNQLSVVYHVLGVVTGVRHQSRMKLALWWIENGRVKP